MEEYISQPVMPQELYAHELNEEKIKNIVAQIYPSNQVEEI